MNERTAGVGTPRASKASAAGRGSPKREHAPRPVAGWPHRGATPESGIAPLGRGFQVKQAPAKRGCSRQAELVRLRVQAFRSWAPTNGQTSEETPTLPSTGGSAGRGLRASRDCSPSCLGFAPDYGTASLPFLLANSTSAAQSSANGWPSP